MTWRIAIVCAALLAGGCAARLGGYAETIEQEIKAINDVNAGALGQAPCAMSLGAWARLENQVKRDANFIGCVPDHERYGLQIITGS